MASSWDDEPFGDRLRRLRESSGYSLRELARRCDVQPSYLSDLERGNRTSVGVTVAVRLAEVLDCTAVELDAPVRISTTTASKAFAIWYDGWSR